MVTVGQLELLPQTLLARAEQVHGYAVARGVGLGVVGHTAAGALGHVQAHAAQPHRASSANWWKKRAATMAPPLQGLT